MPSGFITTIPPGVLELWRAGGPRPGWENEAVCRGLDPNVFHPASDRGDTRPALEYCRVCPVRAECFVEALHQERYRSRDGIWGGATPDERERVWNKLARLRVGPPVPG